MRKIIFLTGTRADYGKMKSIMQSIERSKEFEMFIYVTGMHLLKEYGSTYHEIEKDKFKNIFIEKEIELTQKMDINLGNTIIKFSKYVNDVKPDFIVIHGDRIDALAASIVGILNNIRVIHIEGGELTGTVDDSLRHAITKMSHLHLVSNQESRIRLEQLGEKKESIKVIGSPDIDIMLSDSLPNIEDIKQRYNIEYENYSILMYHPVTTELDKTKENVDQVFGAITKSEKKYICIYPNNDHGSNVILKKLEKLEKNKNIKIFKSFPFEEFLVLLKNSDFIIGNSSAGIREACVYGIPSINVGTRQNKRFPRGAIKNIVNVEEDCNKILSFIDEYNKYRHISYYFGYGNSTELFMKAMESTEFVEQRIQKSFVDLEVTQTNIATYINEVCF